jgi:hypothetical protein
MPKPGPANVFRFGESPFWASIKFSGQPVKGVVFPFKEGANAMTCDIYSVCWEIYAKSKDDLLFLMWGGVLEWDFGQHTTVPIGPLSLFHGSFFDMFFSQGAASDLEQLAQVKTQNEWREIIQTFRIGQTYVYRGLQRYEQRPVTLPAGSKWKVHLRFDGEAFIPKEEVRMRVILNGRWKAPVEIG